MAEIGFYHLTRSGLLDALARLLERTLASGARAVIRCPTEARCAEIDAGLWLLPSPDWLPHGTAADGDADLQPIWITHTDEAPNGAGFLFLVDGAQSESVAGFERVFDLFDGNDPGALAAARDRWRMAKDAGLAVRYWQQGPKGWEAKG